jgi:CPA2 family monovalent cation:H+ antiporter-2
MSHTPLIATLITAFLLAFLLATLANRFRISPLVGYLLAGIAVGPFTPGLVADQRLASELADIGIVLLMFGVGLHFSIKELMAVRSIVLPGAVGAIAIMTALGAALGAAFGWPLAACLIFGLALSVASSVVVLRNLDERRLLQTERGRIAIGWLVVEDATMVFALVLVPALAGLAHGGGAGAFEILSALAIAAAKVVGFVVVMLVVGRRLIPVLLHYVAHTGSRELFRLAVLALSLGTAFGASAAFGVSFALGAFFAGLVLAESTLSQQAARETLPLRDAFAVLFFVSIGMLFDPRIVWQHPLPVLATVGVITLAKPIVAFAAVRLFGRSAPTALFMSASLAQIGEFSFILATLATGLGLISGDARNLILAGSIFSILLNPLAFALFARWEARREQLLGAAQVAKSVAPSAPAPARHAVLVGYGGVGRALFEALVRKRIGVVVIELEECADQPPQSASFIHGNASNPEVLARADLAHADWLFLAIADGFEAGQIVEQAKAANASIKIIARVHSVDEAAHLHGLGADRVVAAEAELARGMVAAAFGAAAIV